MIGWTRSALFCGEFLLVGHYQRYFVFFFYFVGGVSICNGVTEERKDFLRLNKNFDVVSRGGFHWLGNCRRCVMVDSDWLMGAVGATSVLCFGYT